MPVAHFMSTGLGLMSKNSWGNAKKYIGGGWNDSPGSHAWWNEYMRERKTTLLPAIHAYSKAKRAKPDLPNWDPHNNAYGAEITQKMINHYSASTEEEVADVCARISRSYGRDLRTGVPGSRNMPVQTFYDATPFPGTRYHKPRWGTVEPERPAAPPRQHGASASSGIPRPRPPPKAAAMQPFPAQRAYQPVPPRSAEWREACKLDLKFHQQDLLQSADKFLQEVWNANAVENGLSRMLLPEKYRHEPEAITMAFRWSCFKLHPDKFATDSWERKLGWQFITNWHNKELFLAQKGGVHVAEQMP